MVRLEVLRLLLCLLFVDESVTNDDEVVSLPGLKWKPAFKHYAGYLTASDDGNAQMFYWFVESKGTPQKDPIVMWFNGGPGASSLQGLFLGNGPFLFDENDELIENEYAWTKYANLLFLESPADVGFSYVKNGTGKYSDELSSQQNLHALNSFYEKFPQFKNNNLYISGESYAGVFVPKLVEIILRSDSEIKQNLKGYLIVNGGLAYATLQFFADQVNLLYNHRRITDSSYLELKSKCCEASDELGLQCSPSEQMYEMCRQLAEQISIEGGWTKGVNHYNLYRDCDVPPIHNSTGDHSDRGTHRLAYTEDDVCPKYDAYEYYLLRPDVQKAIHIREESNGSSWGMFNLSVFEGYNPKNKDITPTLNYIVDEGVPGFFVNGALDSACPFNMNINVLEKLRQWPQPPTDAKPWLTKNLQVGGVWWEYHPMIKYSTVRGAGHMVVKDKKEEALAMLHTFLTNNYHQHIWH